MEEEELYWSISFVVVCVKIFLAAFNFKRAPSIDQNLNGILTPEKRVQQASFVASNITGAPNEDIHLNIALLNVF